MIVIVVIVIVVLYHRFLNQLFNAWTLLLADKKEGCLTCKSYCAIVPKNLLLGLA